MRPDVDPNTGFAAMRSSDAFSDIRKSNVFYKQMRSSPSIVSNSNNGFGGGGNRLIDMSVVSEQEPDDFFD